MSDELLIMNYEMLIVNS